MNPDSLAQHDVVFVEIHETYLASIHNIAQTYTCNTCHKATIRGQNFFKFEFPEFQYMFTHLYAYLKVQGKVMLAVPDRSSRRAQGIQRVL